ncbi:MAG: DNA polymerase III subunit delta [Clostridia bacterium]|nr:DNA polymerase III subunit delta [Clostridia bacterium]
MNYRELSASIKKGEKHSVYLLHGQEEYVKDRLYEQLYDHLAPQMMPEFNVNILHNPTDEQIIAACMTPPMMADEKLVVARDCPLLGSDEESRSSSKETKQMTDRLTEYLKNLPKSVRIIFIQRGKSAANNRLKKFLSQNAEEVLIDPLESGDAQAWIVSRMKQLGFAMDREAASMLFYYVGPAMGDVASELEKIALYAQGKETVNSADVQTVVQDRSSVRIFTMTDHLGMGRMQKAYEALESVRRGDADSFQTLYMIARQYRMLVRYHQMEMEHMSPADAKKALGVQDFVYRSLQQQARATTLGIALKALDILLDAEDGLKTGRYRDEDLVIDSAIAMIASLYKK